MLHVRVDFAFAGEFFESIIIGGERNDHVSDGMRTARFNLQFKFRSRHVDRESRRKVNLGRMSSEFLYEKALDMTEVARVYTIDYHLAPNAKFGFFLYQVGNSTTKFMSDIGAQVENGPVKQSEIAASKRQTKIKRV